MASLQTPLPSSTSVTPQIQVQKVKVESLAPGLSAVPTRQCSRSIQDQNTQVVCQSFADRIIVLVTQVAKIGCLIQVTPPPSAVLPPTSEAPSSAESEESQLPPIQPSQQTPLLGSPPREYQDLYGLYASQIASIVRSGACDGLPPGINPPPGANRQVIVGLALKSSRASKNLTQPEDEEEDSFLDGTERERFLEIMKMVKEARVW